MKYLEEGTDKELSPSTSVPGKTGETVKVTAAEVAGYTPEKSEDTYVLKAEGNEYIFYYTAKEQAVTVKYLEKGTKKELSPSTSVPGKTGETVKVTAAEVAGYTPEKSEDTYTMKAEGNEYIFYYTANKQAVTVKYLEKGTNKELSPSTSVSGKIGEKVKVTAAKVAGYTPEKSEDSYTMKAGNNEYIFYYTANKQVVTVKYLEKGTNKELSPSTSVPGKTGETVKLTAVKVAGYTPEKSEDSYTMKAGNNEYIFYYTANKQVVTVKYLEKGTNKELSPSTSVSGKTGEKVKVTAAKVAGYTPEKLEDTYTVKAKGNEYIFYYTANKQAVTVKYLEKGTNKELSPSTSVPGKTGETVKVTAAKVAGYTPEKLEDTYTVKAKGNEYIFYYTANKQAVTVKYLEKGTNKELSPSTSVPGKTGETVKVTAAEVEGYTPEKSEDTYVLKAEGNEYIFYYTKDEPTEPEEKFTTVTVRYVDSKSNEEIDREVIDNAVVGKLINLEAKTIQGYTKVAPTSVDYLVEDKEYNEVVFYYTKDEPTEPEKKFTSVTVKYVDRESTEELGREVIENAIVGDRIDLEAKQFTGYTPEDPTTYSYLVEDKEYNEVVFYYTKDEPTEPEESLMLTIYYLDRETGEPVADPDRKYGFEGKEIDLHAKVPTVTDAVYVPEESSHSYTFTDALEQYYEFYYNKQVDPEPAEYTVTIKYLEQGTNRQLATPSTEKGKLGDILTLKAVSVSGYTPTKSSVSYEIKEGESLEYIFYYTKNSSGNPDPSGPSPGGSYTTPLPPPPPVTPLPPVPPKLDTENHFDYIQGYPDGNVKPQNNISREEVAAIFYRLMDDESRANYYSTSNSFSDVKNTRWSNKHISTMVNAGIITGYPDGTFKPGQPITRAEFAAIAARFDKLDDRKSGLFTDISGHWAEKYILSAGNKGWIKGYTDGTFKPNQYITRAEAMSFINSVLNRKVKESGILEDAKKWPDNPATSWYYEDVIEATNNHDYSRNADGYETWEQLKPHRVEP
ncbi:S-layer homology domain-containing protein [Paenibacillus sp. D2_2]|uniref:S-layer homology domain-containing protein n=1 Tax=Paenibacillus sp. D2_2 TaxID=3073092 RepID=UPI0028154F03|nr:S-layer homology domain-containing protein [Paenibacillus sp. D2_2]WMT40826.1 S-layer homology domain-containing protein [Paenibacillus sp. D2_2]